MVRKQVRTVQLPFILANQPLKKCKSFQVSSLEEGKTFRWPIINWLCLPQTVQAVLRQA